MDISPRIISCQDFLRYDAHGKFDTPAMRECLRGIAGTCTRTQVKHALLDVRDITDPPTIVQLFWIAEELPGLGFSALDRVAIVFVDHGEGRANFFATSARTRGINVREFTNFEKAFGWLSTASPANDGE